MEKTIKVETTDRVRFFSGDRGSFMSLNCLVERGCINKLALPYEYR